MRPVGSVLLFGALVCVASEVRADAAIGAISVTNDAEGRCPRSAELEARVDALLGGAGRARRRMIEDRIGVLVRFSADQAQIRAELELFGARSGRRSLHDDSTECSELAESVALTLAILVDPSFVPGERKPNPAAPPATPPPAPPSLPATRSSRARRSGARESATQLSAFAGFGLATRVTSALGPAFGGGAQIDFFDSFALRPMLTWYPPSATELPPGRVEIELWTGSFDACAHLPRIGAALRLSPCVGIALGSIEARARGYRQNGRAWRSLVALDAGLLAELSFGGPFGLWLEANSLWPLQRRSFEVTSAGVVEPTEIVGFSGLVGARVRLW